MNATGPVTLGHLIREGKLLWTYCRDCWRERDVDPATIPLPPEFPVPEVGSRMMCSACDSYEQLARLSVDYTIPERFYLRSRVEAAEASGSRWFDKGRKARSTRTWTSLEPR